MLINYHGNMIQLTEDGAYRPDTLIINGELASMTLYAEHHEGKNWRAYPDGNYLFYQTESGKEYSIPQKRLMDTFQDEIREAIAATGKTMKEVSELTEIPYRTMQDYRSGQRTPNKITREAVLNKINELKGK